VNKRSRGAFGEVAAGRAGAQHPAPNAYELQYTLSNGNRADCVLRLPEPTGLVGTVDSKFPLENYHRMFGAGVGERTARRHSASSSSTEETRRPIHDKTSSQ